VGMNRCPGMSARFFKFDDIKTSTCICCGYELEFWKDDIKVKCPNCKHFNFNPDIGNTCLVWCKSADKCLGNSDIKEWMKKNNK